MYGVIYKITCLVNGKIYIGKTTRGVKVRWKYHCYNKKTTHLYYAIKKHGKENFKIEILCCCYSEIELNNKEIELIAQFDCRNREIGYNILPGGEGFGSKENNVWFGKKHSDETKQKLSELNKGENNPMFGRTGENNPLFEKPRSDETKKKLSIAMSGENNPNFGKPLSEETKKKISIGNIGLKAGANHPMFGKHHSDETKNKMSEALKGEKCYNYGKHLPDEVKDKISEATKGENNPRAKLNWNDVNQIRDLYATGQFTLKQLAEKFLVDLSQISRIILNKSWVV